MKYAFQEYKVTVTNSTEVVSVADVKAALRINCDDDDAYLQMLITAAREMVESATSRVLISSDIEVYQDSFNVESTPNTASILNLFKVPVISVESVEYIKPDTTDGTYTELPTDQYQTDIISEPARIYIPSLPSVNYNTMNAVKVTYKAGYNQIILSKNDIIDSDFDDSNNWILDNMVCSGGNLEYNTPTISLLNVLFSVNFDTPVDLGYQNLVPNTENVDTIGYTLGGLTKDVDYTIDYVNGTITLLHSLDTATLTNGDKMVLEADQYILGSSATEKAPILAVIGNKYKITFDNSDFIVTFGGATVVSGEIFTATTTSALSISCSISGAKLPNIVRQGVTINSTLPQPLKQAIMLIVGHWYENRQDVVTGTQVNEIPETSKWLIDRYRLQLFV